MLKAGVGGLLFLTADGKYELEGLNGDWCDLIAMLLSAQRVKDWDADYHNICLMMLVPILYILIERKHTVLVLWSWEEFRSSLVAS
jgi:hypothetical protein